MNHRKIRNYATLFLAFISFFLGIMFTIIDPTILKGGGGGAGLVIALSAIIVILVTPIFGKLSGIVIYFSVGGLLVYRFIKENKKIKDNT